MSDLRIRISADLSAFRSAMSEASTAANSAVSRMRASFAGLGGATSAPAAALQQYTSQGATGIEGLVGKIGALGSAYAALNAIKAITAIADEATLTTARIEGLTGSMQQTQQAQAALYEMAQRLQAPYAEASASFARMLPAVQQLGGGVQETTRLTELLLTTAKLSGSSAAEAAASATQFAQALGSGVLQGDELKSILENNSTLARTLASGLGVTIGELRKLGEEGKLTSSLVGNTLLASYDDIKAKAATLPATVGGAWTQVENAFSKLVTATGSSTGVFAAMSATLTETSRLVEAYGIALGQASNFSSDLAQERGAITFTQMVAGSFAYLGDVIGAVVRGLVEIIGGLVDIFVAAGESIGAVAAAAVQVAQGNFSEASNIMAQSAERGARAVNRLGVAMGEAAAAQVQAIAGEGPALTAYVALLEKAAAAGDKVAASKRADTGLSGGGKDDGKDKTPKSRMSQWEDALDADVLAYAKLQEQQRTYHEFTRQQEVAWWQQRLATQNLTAQERLDIEAKITRLELAEITGRNDKAAAEAKKLAEATREAEQIRRDMAEARALAAVDAEEAEARAKLDTQQITQAQFLQAELAFEEARFQIRAKATEAMLELAKKEGRDPAEVERINAQLLDLELQYQQRRQQIQLDQAQTGGPLAGIMPDVGTLEQALTTMFDMTQTWGQKVRGIFRGIADTFTQELIIKPLAQMLMRYIRETALYRMLFVQQTTGQAVASATVAATKAGEATAVVGANAAEAASGAAASQAAIPFVGPALAIGAFAAIMAMVLGARSSIKSAAGGYDIPAGINPVTQLHAEEMVLPAEHANTIRQLGAAGGSIAPNVNVEVRGESVGGWLLMHKSELAKAIKAAHRGFSFA